MYVLTHMFEKGLLLPCLARCSMEVYGSKVSCPLSVECGSQAVERSDIRGSDISMKTSLLWGFKSCIIATRSFLGDTKR